MRIVLHIHMSHLIIIVFFTSFNLTAVLSQRIKLLQCQLQSSSNSPGVSGGSSGSGGGGPSGTGKARQLPCIEEAWNIPVAQEMASRQEQQSVLHRGAQALGATVHRGHQTPVSI